MWKDVDGSITQRRHNAVMGTMILKPNQTVVCLGDSITQDPNGYVTLASGLVAAMMPTMNVRFVNAGIGGHKSNDMLGRLERDVISQSPDWVTVSCGVNDVWHGFFNLDGSPNPSGDGPSGVSITDFRRDMAEIVRRIKFETQAQVMLLTPTIIGEEADTPQNIMLEMYVAAVRQLAKDAGCALCDMREGCLQTLTQARSIDRNFSLTTDGVHMNCYGASVMTVALLRAFGFALGE